MRIFSKQKIARFVIFVAFLLGLSRPAAAQFTQVTGTVQDPSGIPYSGGTISAILVPGSSGGYRLSGQPYSGRVGPATLDSTGSFVLQFGSNALITPASTQWQITVNSAAATIQLPLGTGPQSFQVTVTISGSSQSLTSTLEAAAPKLTNFATGGTPPAAPNGSVQFNNSGAFGGNALLNWNNSTDILTVGPSMFTGLPLGVSELLADTTPLIVGNVNNGFYAGVGIVNQNTTMTFPVGGLAAYIVNTQNSTTVAVDGESYVGPASAATFNQSIDGVLGAAINDGAGTVADMDGVSAVVQNTGSGTTTAGPAFHAQNPLVTSGTLTNGYGLLVDSITTAVNNYAIYTNAGPVRFGDNLQEAAHINQTATKNFAGTCTMSTTTCTFALNAGFSSTPICIVTEQGTAAIAAACSVSGTTVTITAASSNTDTWGAILIGNPN